MSIDSIPRALGRYVLYDQIAAGGMASVHLGRLHGAVGFSRVVAIKRLHANYAQDPRFVQMFLDEARLAALVKHPNVVSTLDVVADDTEVFLVMEHVLGESLERLMPPHTREPPPPSVAVAVVVGMLEGLHAAHETRDELGRPLSIVHRDVSPHNVLVDRNGLVRVFDFGIAKASDRLEQTREGVVKGKVAYMAPEQVRGNVDRRADVFASGVVLWELLTGRRRQAGRRNDELFLLLATGKLEPPPKPSTLRPGLPPALDAVVERATAIDPEARFATARDMASALERALEPSSPRDVASWLDTVARQRLDELGQLVRRIASDGPSDEARSEGRIDVRSGTGSRSVFPAGRSIFPAGTITNAVSSSVAPRVTSLTPSSSQRRPFWITPAALLVLAGALLFIGFRLRPMRRGEAALQAPPSTSEGVPQRATAREGQGAASSVTMFEASPEAAAPDAQGDAQRDAQRAAARPSREAAVGESENAVTPSKPNEAHKASSGRRAPPAVVRAAPPTASASPAKAPPSVPKASCDSPFVVGADGIRQIKPECM